MIKRLFSVILIVLGGILIGAYHSLLMVAEFPYYIITGKTFKIW